MLGDVTNSLKRKQFGVICFVEMWERYAFYGFQTLFMLFLTSQHMSESQGYLIFGIFSGLLWILPTFGGALADKVIGVKRALIVGGLLLATGYLLLAFSDSMQTFMLALAFIVTGNGIFKPAPSALVSLIFNKDATQSKSAFTLYYMAVNVGSTVGGIVGPYIALYSSYKAAFFVAFVGMLLSLGNLFLRLKLLKEVNGLKDNAPLSIKIAIITVAFSVVSIVVCYILLNLEDITPYVIVVVWVLALSYLFMLAFKTEDIKSRIKQIIGIILFIEAVAFFVVYNQMFSTITMFAKHNVVNFVLGIPVSPATYASLNPIWIVALSPIIAWFYIALKRANITFDILSKYVVGTMLAGLAFISLALASTYFNVNGMVSGNWLILYFALGSLAELLVAAMGFAIAALYFPKAIVSIVMGVFMISIAQGGNLTGIIAQYVAIPERFDSKMASLNIFINYFYMLGIACVAIAVVYFFLAIYLRKLARKHEVDLG